MLCQNMNRTDLQKGGNTMIDLNEITKACTDDENIEVLKAVEKILEVVNNIFKAERITAHDQENIHNLLNNLNGHGYFIYANTKNDIDDAKKILFESDNIWKRGK